MSPVNVSAIGAYIREQREQAKISLRQLAQSAGISNPYLSQIERGLRRPSADILQQIAKGLRISAEALYVQAGFLEDRPPGSVVREAVLTDEELTERQKQMLIEIYESFRKETALAMAADAAGIMDDQTGLDPDEAALIWPDDRSPAAVASRAKLAIAAEPHHRGSRPVWAVPEAQDADTPEARAAGTGAQDEDSPEARAAGTGAQDEDTPEARAAGTGAQDEDTPGVRAAGTGAQDEDTPGVRAAGTGAEDEDSPQPDGAQGREEPDGPGGTIHQFPPPAGNR